MTEKFPYGYELDAYIDKAFELMKEEFPWATRDMIAEHTCYGIEKMGDDYQYVSYSSRYDGTLKPYTKNVDCDGFLRLLASGHDWELEHANPVKETFDVPASCRCSGDWYLWEEFLDKYLDLVSPGPFYVSRADLEAAEGLKAFLGFKM